MWRTVITDSIDIETMMGLMCPQHTRQIIKTIRLHRFPSFVLKDNTLLPVNVRGIHIYSLILPRLYSKILIVWFFPQLYWRRSKKRLILVDLLVFLIRKYYIISIFIEMYHALNLYFASFRFYRILKFHLRQLWLLIIF